MASAQVAEGQLEELPIETRSVKALQLQQLKRSFDLFAGNYGSKPDVDTGRSVSLATCDNTDMLCPFRLWTDKLLFLAAAKKPS